MELATYIIDTFTSEPFKGNPTAVCYNNDTTSTDYMLAMAKELNFPVTAFINKRTTNDSSYTIRYFTPTTEIPACGHATLAAASIVYKQTNHRKVKFITADNISIDASAEEGQIRMTYPKYNMVPATVSKPTIASLGIERYTTAGYCKELETLFIEIESAQVLRAVQPNYDQLLKSSDTIKEVVITALSNTGNYDYVLRSFCPWIGINEDPVTGSVHSVLAPFWGDRLNKTALKAYQASARGGEIFVKALEDKVEIGGQAIIILEGKLSL